MTMSSRCSSCGCCVVLLVVVILLALCCMQWDRDDGGSVPPLARSEAITTSSSHHSPSAVTINDDGNGDSPRSATTTTKGERKHSFSGSKSEATSALTTIHLLVKGTKTKLVVNEETNALVSVEPSHLLPDVQELLRNVHRIELHEKMTLRNFIRMYPKESWPNGPPDKDLERIVAMNRDTQEQQPPAQAELDKVRERLLDLRENEFDRWLLSEKKKSPDSTAPNHQALEALAKRLCDEAEGLRELDLTIEKQEETHEQTTANDTAGECVVSTPAVSVSTDKNAIVNWRGVSVDWVHKCFLETWEAKRFVDFGCRMWFVRDFAIPEMLKRRGILSGSVVDHLDKFAGAHRVKDNPREQNHDTPKTIGSGSSSTPPSSSQATAFVSYTGAYTLEDFAELLGGADLKDRYVWIDVFCVNQFAWKRKDEEMMTFKKHFMYQLKNQIGLVGYTVLMLDNWDDLMSTLGRIWVLWEIFSTADRGVNAQNPAKLHLLLREIEQKRFMLEALSSGDEGFRRMQKSLSKIDVRNATSWVASDKTLILEVMDETDGVFNVNALVIQKMREWLLHVGRTYYDKLRVEGHDSVHWANNLAVLYSHFGQFTEAEKLLRQELEKNSPKPGKYHKSALDLITNLGNSLFAQGKYSEAESVFREAITVHTQKDGAGHPDTVSAKSNLAVVLTQLGRDSEAEVLLRESFTYFDEVYGDADPRYLGSIQNMADRFRRRGELEEAEAFFRRAMDLRRQEYGDKHPDTLEAVNNMATLLLDRGKPQEAIKLYRDVVIGFREQLGSEHAQTLSAIHNLAKALHDQGTTYSDAEGFYHESLLSHRAQFGNKHPKTLAVINSLGELLRSQGRFREAEVYSREAVDGYRAYFGDNHPETLTCITNLAEALVQDRRLSEAEPLSREALNGRREKLGGDHPLTLSSISNLANLLRLSKRFEEAELYSREAVDGYRKKLGGEHADTLRAIDNLSMLLFDQGKLQEAESYGREAVHGLRRELGSKHPDTLMSITNLAGVFSAQGRPDEAAMLYVEALLGHRQVLGDNHPNTQVLRNNVVKFLVDREG